MRGFYSVQDAARLIEVGNARRILGWLRGYPGRTTGPVISRDYQPIDNYQVLSFLDLIEIRFIEHFREQGVRVQTLRRAIETARIAFGTQKPLATRHIRFTPTEDRKDILVEEVLRPAAQEAKDPKLWSLMTAQYVIFEAIRTRLLKGLTFDTETLLAKSWQPRPDEFPDILIDPTIAYGQPTLPSRVPTKAIYSAWKAGEQLDSLADWYQVPFAHAEVAVAFERHIRAPKQALAA